MKLFQFATTLSVFSKIKIVLNSQICKMYWQDVEWNFVQCDIFSLKPGLLAIIKPLRRIRVVQKPGNQKEGGN